MWRSQDEVKKINRNTVTEEMNEMVNSMRLHGETNRSKITFTIHTIFLLPQLRMVNFKTCLTRAVFLNWGASSHLKESWILSGP